MRVLDLADESIVYATRLLADLGADVIRVESPVPDGIRRWHLPGHDQDHGGARDGPFHRFFNAGKRSIALDLRTPEGRQLFSRLCATADVVVDGIAPVWPTDLTAESVAGLHQDLVWVAVREFVPGARRDGKSSEIVRCARSGLMSITGTPDGPPVMVGGGLADAVTAVNAALAAFVGWMAARQRGTGLLVWVSAYETLVEVMQQGLLQAAALGTTARRGGMRHGHVAVAGAVPCSDGFFVVSANETTIWKSLVQLIGDPRLNDERLAEERERQRRESEIFEVIGQWAGPQSKESLAVTAQGRHIPAAPVQDLSDVLNDPQLHARRFFQPLEGSEIPVFLTPWSAPLRPAPLLGQHTHEILGDIGIAPAELRRMAERGVIGEPEAELFHGSRQ